MTHKIPLKAAALAVFFFATACGSNDAIPGSTPEDAQTNPPAESTAETFSLTTPENAFCPDGSKYDRSVRFCVKGNEAFGPFPKGMVDKCKETQIDSACEKERWSASLAKTVRGTGVCPVGTQYDDEVVQCVAGTNVYGPFSNFLVDRCQSRGGGQACESNRWSRDILSSARLSVENFKILNYYSKESNYNRVYDDVMSWFGTTKNGCVAFMSSALRHVGIHVPKNRMIDGYNISLVTSAFSEYLEGELKWRRITKHKELMPGDVVFTLSEPEWPGIPAHVYMFQKWKDKGNAIAWVVDNQDFTHERNILGSGSFNFTPYWYALRSKN